MPQTEAEWQLLEDVHIVTRLAADEGVSKARIASLLGFMASAAAQQAAFEQSPQRPAQRRREQAEPPADPDVPVCPECGDPIESIGGTMGMAEAEPCGHEIEDDELIRELINDR